MGVATQLCDARVKWEMIGRKLNINSNDLDCIKAQHGNNFRECLYQMIVKWMKSGRATMNDLLRALRDQMVGHEALANKIMQGRTLA